MLLIQLLQQHLLSVIGVSEASLIRSIRPEMSDRGGTFVSLGSGVGSRKWKK